MRARSRHFLTNIDITTMLADCAECGPRVLVYRSSATTYACANRAKAAAQARHPRLTDRQRFENATRSGRHSMKEVDPETSVGECAVCGPGCPAMWIPLHRRWGCRARTWTQGAERGPDGMLRPKAKLGPHKRTTASPNARPYLRFKKDYCEREGCGFIPEHPCQLDVHHRDRDRRNNSEENCVTLCSNCHRLDHVGQLEPLIRAEPPRQLSLATAQ